MNTWKTTNAVVRHLEATTPVYEAAVEAVALLGDVVDGRALIIDAPLEGDVVITHGVRTHEGLRAELRVRDDVGGWAR